jgi:hypothetical protein
MKELLALTLTGGRKSGATGRRIGDCCRRRRLCFAENPAKAAYYAGHRARRFARRMLGT